jgi:hypothetical protein
MIFLEKCILLVAVMRNGDHAAILVALQSALHFTVTQVTHNFGTGTGVGGSI